MQLTYLRELPKGPLAVGDHFRFFMAAPFDEDEYVLSPEAADRCFPHLSRRLHFSGTRTSRVDFFISTGGLGGYWTAVSR